MLTAFASNRSRMFGNNVLQLIIDAIYPESQSKYGSMKEFKRILVPVDGSELSMIAFQKALNLAEWVGGRVDIVYVSEYPMTGPVGMEQPANINPQPDFSKIIDPYLEISRKSHIRAGKEVKRGIPQEEIVKMSSEYDLIIMGTRGKNPILSMILGSVAEHVSRHAFCPVMLIRRKMDK